MHSVEEAEFLGLEEQMTGETITLVEWPDRARELLMEAASGRILSVVFSITGPEEREISINELKPHE